MPDHSRLATYAGQVASVRGATISVRLKDVPSTLVMVDGHSYRIGQVGAFLRIPQGYTDLFGVCTQVGADAAPNRVTSDPSNLEAPTIEDELKGYRWLTLALFGEALGGEFERGVGQYPAIGDEVHLVTPSDLSTIYGGEADGDVVIGRIADSSAVPARLQLGALISRHSCIVGSTGAGKSNLVAVMLEALSGQGFPSARVLVIDPHGEYASSLGARAQVIRTGIGLPAGDGRLRVPFWALPFDELVSIAMDDLPAHLIEPLRDRVRSLKLASSVYLASPPPPGTVTADSPIPFSLRALWLELEHDERATYSSANDQTEATKHVPLDPGDIVTLKPPEYPPATSYNSDPYISKKRRGIGRQLEVLRSRMLDSRYGFMFGTGDDLAPDEEGKTTADLDSLIASLVGSPKPVTILDVSGLPGDVTGPVVGSMVRLVYDALFWASGLAVGGRQQPLLIVVDEAHRFLPNGGSSPAHRCFSRIAKEGRKYGIGLMLVSQRPSDVDQSVLSQCGTMLALRLTNGHDRSAVANALPDDLGGLSDLLPALRTGELIAVGDALKVPSRVRVRRATLKPVGDDPDLPDSWRKPERPDAAGYSQAVKNWRAQSVG